MPRIEYPSFVRRTQMGLELWSPVVTDDWSKDMAQGRSYAGEVISYMTETGQSPFLRHVVKAMIGNGAWTGVECGFFQLIGIELTGKEAIHRIMSAKHGYDQELSPETAT